MEFPTLTSTMLNTRKKYKRKHIRRYKKGSPDEYRVRYKRAKHSKKARCRAIFKHPA